jgi:hypothetical protein
MSNNIQPTYYHYRSGARNSLSTKHFNEKVVDLSDKNTEKMYQSSNIKVPEQIEPFEIDRNANIVVEQFFEQIDESEAPLVDQFDGPDSVLFELSSTLQKSIGRFRRHEKRDELKVRQRKSRNSNF